MKPDFRPSSREPLEEFLSKRTSMLNAGSLPIGYSTIEHSYDAEAAAYPKSGKQVRLYIVWDNELNNLPLTEVLDRMRETGAAMVYKVEPIS